MFLLPFFAGFSQISFILLLLYLNCWDNLNFYIKNILWATAFFLVALAWVYGLKIDLTGDSGLYAAISRQMVESGNWLDLKINGEPYDQKPHLLFWLAGLGIQLFGNTNVAYKLFLFLFGVTGIYFTWRLGRLLFSEAAGRLAALFTGTSQLFFLYFFDIHTDTVLQSAVTLSLWQFATYLEHKKRVNFIIAFAGMGLAMLTKGPVGAVLPFLFVLFYLLLKRDYRQLFHPKWLAGIILVLLIISPTLYHLYKSFGIHGLRFYFIDNNLGRVSGEVAGSSTDPFFYLYNLLWAFLPWTVPVMAGLTAEVRSWINKGNLHRFSASLLGSVLVLFIVYSIARGKAPNYLMMLMPPLAVVAAGRMQQFMLWSLKVKKILFGLHFLVLAILIVILILSGRLTDENNSVLLIVLVGLVLVLSVLFVKVSTEKLKQVVFFSLLSVGTLNLFLNTTVLPAFFDYQGAKQALNKFTINSSGKGILKNLHLEEYELFFEADIPVEPFYSWNDFYGFLESDEPWVYTDESGLQVVTELKPRLDSVFVIPQRGMNEFTFQFLNPKTRRESLKNNYLIKVK
jgi:4-amino-4-deoxy-L-arabinose transferase-like glycosyltransferase